MNAYLRIFVITLLMSLVASAFAAPIVIPKDTVIPVKLDTALNSGTASVGDTFYAYHEGVNGGGFPEYSNFAGRIESVTKATGSTAGQIGVVFVSVHLPNGMSVPIDGTLTSLDQDSVRTDPNTGRLMGTTQASKNAGKFIAIGAGAGLILGQAISKKPLIGTIIGAAAGYLYGRKQATPALGKNVDVPAGTSFGILIRQEVTLPETMSATPMAPSTDVSTQPGTGWRVRFDNLKPVMSGNDLMVPFRSVMDSIGMPFDYNNATKTIRVERSNTAPHTVQTAVGSRLVYLDGMPIRFDTASRFINGTTYVPASYIELMTNRSAYWNQRTGVLRIE